MPYTRFPNANLNVRTSALVGMVLALTASANAQTFSFVGVPSVGGQGNIGQTDPSCQINGNTITCPNGGVVVHFAIFIAGWDDGSGRGVGAVQATVDGGTLDNGSFQIIPVGFGSTPQWGGYINTRLCSGGASDGIACGHPTAGPYGPGAPGVDEAECQADGGQFCVLNNEFFMACCNAVVGIIGPSHTDLDFFWGAAPTTPDGAIDPGVPAYMGDYVLQIPAGASGEWTIRWLNEPNRTFMNDDQSGSIPISALLPAVVRIDGDCNTNGVSDFQDIAAGTSTDCNGNATPDECDLLNGTSEDCNDNATLDSCELASGASDDCNNNDIPDECDLDCDANGIPDDCDLASGTGEDCNSNGALDSCELASGAADDCNANGVPDTCDDCNSNGTPDEGDIFSGFSLDCNSNCVPDECDDCNGNGTPDVDDIAATTSLDCNTNCVPDECEPDCNLNTIPDDCDITDGTSLDANGDGLPDECLRSPTLPAPPHDTSKNRYLSLVPQSGAAMAAMSIALPDGREGWISQPVLKDFLGSDPQFVSWVVDQPVMRIWTEPVIHIAGCVISPDQLYEIRATLGNGVFTDPYNTRTTITPNVGTWADTVGTFDEGTQRWSPSNNVVNFLDISAAIGEFQQMGRAPVTWIDIVPQWPNYHINFVDIAAVNAAFQEIPYAVSVPGFATMADCPLGGPL